MTGSRIKPGMRRGLVPISKYRHYRACPGNLSAEILGTSPRMTVCGVRAISAPALPRQPQPAHPPLRRKRCFAAGP
jgi:hypothetical protein